MSYCTIEQVKQYADERGIELKATDNKLGKFLVLSMDYIESFSFVGNKTDKEQANEWPRCGTSFPNNEAVPSTIVYAQIEAVLALDEGADLLGGEQTAVVTSESTEGASTTYGASGYNANKNYHSPKIHRYLKTFLANSNAIGRS